MGTELIDRVAVVTGASRGIGRAAALPRPKPMSLALDPFDLRRFVLE